MNFFPKGGKICAFILGETSWCVPSFFDLARGVLRCVQCVTLERASAQLFAAQNFIIYTYPSGVVSMGSDAILGVYRVCEVLTLY